MFQEDGQNVESLVNLAVSVDQVAIVHSQHIVHADVHVNASQTVLVLEKWDLDGWYVA